MPFQAVGPGKQPKPKWTIWNMLFWMKPHISRWEIRYSSRRLLRCSNPLQSLFRLLWPLIPWTYVVPEQYTLEHLRTRPTAITRRHIEVIEVQDLPLFRSRDSLLRAIYRLYEHLCMDDHDAFRNESKYIWYNPSWRVFSIPDPQDPDPTRYACVASLVEALATMMNWKQENRMRRDDSPDMSDTGRTHFPREFAPAWTHSIPPLEKQVNVIFSIMSETPLAKLDEHFLSRNIEANMAYLYFV